MNIYKPDEYFKKIDDVFSPLPKVRQPSFQEVKSLDKIFNSYVKQKPRNEEEGWFMKMLDYLNRPLVATTYFVDNILTKDLDTALKRAKEGFLGELPTHTWIDLSHKYLPKDIDPYVKTGIGFIGDIIMDPANLIPFGKVFGLAGKGVKSTFKISTNFLRKIEPLRKTLNTLDDVIKKVNLKGSLIGQQLRKYIKNETYLEEFKKPLFNARRLFNIIDQRGLMRLKNISKDMSVLLKNIDKDTLNRSIINVLETGKTKFDLPKDVEKQIFSIANKFKDIYSEIAKYESKLGFLNPERIMRNYYPHYFKKDLAKEMKMKYLKKGAFSDVNLNLKERTIKKTIDELAKHFDDIANNEYKVIKKLYEKNPNKIIDAEKYMKKLTYFMNPDDRALLRILPKGMPVSELKFYYDKVFKKSISDFIELNPLIATRKRIRALAKEHSAYKLLDNIFRTKDFVIDKDELTVANQLRKLDWEDISGIDLSKEIKPEDFRRLRDLSEKKHTYRKLNIDVNNDELNQKIKKYMVRDDIADEVERVWKVYFSPESKTELGKIYDTIHNYLKAWTIFPFPSYYVRNMVGNLWNNYLADVKNPLLYKKAFDYQRLWNAGKFNELRKIPINFGNKKYSLYKILEDAMGVGVFDKGQFTADIFSELENYSNLKRGGFIGLIKNIISLNPNENPITSVMQKYGNMIENNARLTHYLDKLEKYMKQGDDYHTAIKKAIDSVNKYLFDYSDKTPFEKKVLNRIFLFYYFTKNNIPLQIEHFLKTPQKFSNILKTKRAIEYQNKDVDANDKFLFAPEFMKDFIPLKYKIDSNGDLKVFALKNFIPATDLAEISEPISFLVQSMTPFLKYPIENFLNYNMYLKKNIEDFKGQKGKFLGMNLYKRSTLLNPVKTLEIFWNYGPKDGLKAVLGEDLLRNIRVLNFLNSLYNIGKEENNPDKKIDIFLKVVLGKTYTYNLDRNYKFYVNTLKKLRSRIKFDMKKNKSNKSIVADYERRLQDINEKLKEAQIIYKDLKRKEKFGL